MEEIVWFKKTVQGNNRNESDITVSMRKGTKKNTKAIAITFRNGVAEEFKSEHLRFGLSKDGKKMFFLPANKEEGWKLSGVKGSSTKNIVIADERIEALFRFIGDYSAQISDDDIIYIDSRERV